MWQAGSGRATFPHMREGGPRGDQTASERTGERKTRLLGCALGSAGQPLSENELMATSQLTRLSQARGYLRSGKIFIE